MSDTYVLRPLPAREPHYRLDYRGLLNEAQYEAVAVKEGPVLVVAGAGSGKTRTLVFRVARLVESGVDPGSILLLTFTRKAAGEMLRRASELLDGRCDRVAGGTFHSFANTVLRRYGSALDLPPAFTILDRGDAEDILSLLRGRLGFDRKERRFPRKNTIADMLSAAINKSRPLPEILEEEYAHLLDYAEEIEQLRDAYAKYKAERALLDYDDLLVRLHQLLAEHEPVRKRLADTYRFVMVDEYQDTNSLQAAIVGLLAGTHRNVMAVGDDAQSIYAFRGANFRNIMDFPKLFAGARVITLEQNYRSTQPILDLTNGIIAQARERYSKTLFTERGDGEVPLLVAADNENYQSRFVCQRVLELREEGVPLRDIAVLFRSAYHSFDLELELTRHDIPFVKRGGFRFTESAHIKDVLAHLRVLANPRDAVSWHRLLLLLEGIGPRGAERIIAVVGQSADVAAALDSIGGKGPGDLRALAGLFRRLRGAASPAEQLHEVLRYYDPVLQRVHRDDYPKRQRDLEQFVAIASRYKNLEAMLADMALEPPADSVDDALAADPDDERLVLSTIHSAKGLEWHTVFILWAAEGRFPSNYSANDPDALEEELRLMYVATTRARQNLYITYPRTMFDRTSGMVYVRPSQFVDDLPRTLLRRVEIVESP